MEIDLNQARRRAKELLRAARAGDADALARMRDDRVPRLADAQRAVAAQLGLGSWPALVAQVEASSGDQGERRARLVRAALSGRADIAERLVAHDPGLTTAGLDVALVLGDEPAVAAALDRDPSLVARDLPGVGRKPLSCACHSVFLRPSSPRAPGVRRVVALLLERGADPNDNESVYNSVEGDDTTCLELLLAGGASVRGTNALANAIRDPVKVRVLLEQGDLRPSDPELRDALLHARSPAVVELLIEHGAALDARDRDGLTPYSHAARLGSEETMKLLAAAGANTEIDPAAEWIGAIVRGDDERAARVKADHPNLVLHDADAEELPRWASAGDDEVVARLLDAGVPIDARGVDDATALHVVGMWARANTVDLLLARGADPELMAGPREHADTALSWTAWGSRRMPGAAERLDGYLAAAVALLEAGARVTEGMIETAADELSVVLEEAGARTGILRVTELSYTPGRPVRISVRRRGHRYDIDDMGTAVALAGHPPGWREAAERTVQGLGWNLNRAGVVLMHAVEGRDIDALVQRTAEASAAVLEALLEIEE